MSITNTLKTLLSIYDNSSQNSDDLFDQNFMATIRQLIIHESNEGLSYEAERENEWRRIAEALGDNEPDCSGFGFWAGEIEAHADAIKAILRGKSK